VTHKIAELEASARSPDLARAQSAAQRSVTISIVMPAMSSTCSVSAFDCYYAGTILLGQIGVLGNLDSSSAVL